MTNDDTPAQDRVLQELLDQLCAGDFTSNQQRQLIEQLSTSQQARREYLRHLNLHAELNWQLGRQEAGETAPLVSAVEAFGDSSASKLQPIVPISAKFLSRAMRTSVALWTLALVANCALVYLLAVAVAPQLRERWGGDLAAQQAAQADSGATITHTASADWRDSLPRTITTNVPLRLNAGLVELQLRQGTTLLIEGPAEWTIDGDNSATLKQGKVLAKVPQPAIGFTLETPTAKIVDLGTEFGVKVDAAGHSDVHLIAGEVTVEVAHVATPQPPLRLETGQAYQVRREELPRAIPFAGPSFEKLETTLKRGPAPRFLLISGGKPVTSDSTFTHPGGAMPFTPQAVTDGRLSDRNLGDDYFYWIARSGGPAEFIVDLQAVREVADIQLLNTHNGSSQDRGTKDFRISFSTDGQRYTPALEGTLESVILVESPKPERFEIEPPTFTRYVKFEALSCYGRSAGLNEIQVFGLPLEQKRRAARP